MASSRKECSWAATAFICVMLACTGSSTETVGCFLYGYRFNTAPLPLNVSMPLKGVLTKLQCQSACATQPGCDTFAYFADSMNCFLGADAIELVSDPNVVSGPAACPKVPAVCTDLPGAGFPAKTVRETFAAWPSGLQPPPFQCWPRTADGQLSPCYAQVLDDMNNGWGGMCWGLSRVHEPGNETCGASCERSLDCPSFQTVMFESKLLCWQGWGKSCNDDRSIRVLSAKRFLRGSYRVLRSLLDVTVMGMSLAFNQDHVHKSLGGNQITAIRECNHTCLSLIECETWQYSKKWGCYVDVKSIGYPGIVPNVFHYNATFLESVVAGEYIQRFCGRPPIADGLTSPVSARLVTWAPRGNITKTIAPVNDNASEMRQWQSYLKRMEQGTDGSSASAPSNVLGLPKVLFFSLIALLLIGLVSLSLAFLPTLSARCRKNSCGRGIELSRSSEGLSSQSRAVPSRKRTPETCGEQVQQVLVPNVALTPPCGLWYVPVGTLPAPLAAFQLADSGPPLMPGDVNAAPETRFVPSAIATYQPIGDLTASKPYAPGTYPPIGSLDPYETAADRLHAAWTHQPTGSCASFTASSLDAPYSVVKAPVDQYEAAAERLRAVASGKSKNDAFSFGASPTATFAGHTERSALLGP